MSFRVCRRGFREPETEKNAVDILKWSNIYERLEACFDTCESIAYTAEEILLKNT